MPSAVNYLIVHGALGSPDENWFRWLEKKLQGKGKVLLPTFPTPKGQTFDNWKKVTNTTLANYAPENIILIGHSSGAVFVLRMAEQTTMPYKAVIAVCPFMRDLELPEFDKLNDSFIHPEPDWARIKKGAGKIVCYAGDNDPYVPLSYSKEVAQNSAAECVVIEKGGHLNTAAGYSEFPLLLAKIQQLSS